MVIEVEVPQTTISNKAIEVEYSNSNTAIAEGTKELEVTVNRREYSIVGDELYIPKRYEDAPQWLRDIIDTVTSAALSNALSDVSTLGNMLDGLIAELNVAKNTYTMSIISDNDINERINTAIETLNSSLADADSTILNIALTRVTPEEAQTIVLGILSASINGGDIAAAVQNLQSAIADVDSARALDYTRLTAQIGDGLEDEATARSEAISYLTTGVSNINGTLTTQAGQITALQTSASTVDNRIATAKSDVTNTLNTTITNGDIAIQSKWAYNSIVNINGVYKKSGFGLTTNYTSGNGTEANPYVSEFWIDASRFKFTNSNQTGQVAPFTIDASGTTPQVKFNGVVEFSNTTGGQDAINASLLSANTYSDSITAKGTNLIYADWATGSGATSGYNINGTTDENYRVYGDNHLGNIVVLWECRPDSVNDGDGGWNTNSFAVDQTKSYRFSVFVKTSANTGTTFLGCGGNTVVDLNTSTLNSNPYFWYGDLPTQNEWYLIVGYVHPYSSTGITTKGGIYNCTTGAKVSNISSDFAWSSTTTTSYHRCYHYYDTTTTTRQWMWNPRVEQITGNEPSILDLIGNFTKVEDISWQSEVQAAINNNATIIDGDKIVTNAAFVNNLNAVGGVAAAYITASEINGITINGGIINGARINGAVIKASYLDLDGELEVLTNYHISVATRNANPSLYTDAVYISADNEYRIPSMSTIKNSGSATITEALNNTVRYMYISETIKSYNNANSNHNNKCVKINPSFNILTSKLYYYSDRRFDIHSRNTGAATIYLCSFYVNSQEVARCYHSVVAGGTCFIRILDVRRNVTYSSSSFSVSSSSSFNAVMLDGLNVSVNISASTYDPSDTDLPYGFIYSVYLNPCVVSSISNFTSGNLLYMSYYSYYHYGYAFGSTQAFRTYAYNPASNITVNNMI